MEKRICENCGWVNDNNLIRCQKCNDVLSNYDASRYNQHEIIQTETSSSVKSIMTNGTLIWRYKSYFLLFAIISIICVVVATILLYSHYGSLTPNGNRYYHSFNLQTVPFYLILLASGAMAILYFPIFKLYRSKSPNNFKFGIFPLSKSIISKVISVLLSILNLGSGLVFTVSFILITFEYVCNSSRIMADDLETIIQVVSYGGCIIFWGIVDLLYTLIFKHDW